MKKLIHISVLLLFCVASHGKSVVYTTDSTLINICESNSFGSKKITEGNASFTSYKNLLRALDLAERNKEKGLVLLSKNNLKNALKLVENVLKKEPEADLSDVCFRIRSLQNNTSKGEVNIVELGQSAFKVTFLLQNYRAYVEGYYEKPQYAKQRSQITELKSFDRAGIDQILSKPGMAANSAGGMQLKMQLDNFDQVVAQEGIVNHLYGLLDELNNSAAQDLADRSKRTLDVISAFNAIGGENTELKGVMDYANKQVQRAEKVMSEIYTGDFHRSHVNEIIFTKKPFIPGKETDIKINPVFKTGDPIYATMYLSANVNDALTTRKNAQGEEMTMTILDENGVSLYGRFEKWEVENYASNVAMIYKGVPNNQSFYQFLLLPAPDSDIAEAVLNRNFTPVHLVRGAAHQPQRKKKFSVVISTFGKKTNSKELSGSFEMDFSHGDAPLVYTQLDNRMVEAFIAKKELPKPYKKDTVLEGQLLENMRTQGHSETYTKAIIQSDWRVVKPLGGKEYKEMECAFPYKTVDGQCGYRTYTFKSFRNGNGGWTKPQKFGGTDAAERVPCHKL